MPKPKMTPIPAPPNDQTRRDLLPPNPADRLKRWQDWLAAADVTGPGKAAESKRRVDGIKKFGDAYSSAMGTAQSYGGYKPRATPTPSKIAGGSGVGSAAGKAAEAAKKAAAIKKASDAFGFGKGKNKYKSFGSVAGNSSKSGMNIGKSISDLGKTAVSTYAKGYNILGAGLPAKILKELTQAGKSSTAGSFGSFKQSAVKSKTAGKVTGSVAGKAAAKKNGSAVGSAAGKAAAAKKKAAAKTKMTFG